MVELLNWVLFGALSGWITALMMRTDTEPREAAKQLIAGAFGAIIGGTAYIIFSSTQGVDGFRSGGLMIAIVCSILAAIIIGNLANKFNLSKRG